MKYLKQSDRHDYVIWILLVIILWYIFICGFLTYPGDLIIANIIGEDASDGMKFVCEMYLSTIVPFLCIIIYCAITKRNRFILKSFLPGKEKNKLSKLFNGFLVGFIMNFGCILLALIHGDIKLFNNFIAAEIPFFIFAFVCVFIQSTSEELWCRGFMYERIYKGHPLWVAIAVNGVFFGLLHCFNPGVSFIPIFDICICGLAFSLAKWYTGSIWFPMGIHTGWNFTQNFLFGLPNSGLVSEASIIGLDAATARDSFFYNAAFGIEGAMPAVFADAILGIVCLVLAAKKGRLSELLQPKNMD